MTYKFSVQLRNVVIVPSCLNISLLYKFDIRNLLINVFAEFRSYTVCPDEVHVLIVSMLCDLSARQHCG